MCVLFQRRHYRDDLAELASDNQRLQWDGYYANTARDSLSPVGFYIKSVLLKFTRNDLKQSGDARVIIGAARRQLLCLRGRLPCWGEFQPTSDSESGRMIRSALTASHSVVRANGETSVCAAGLLPPLKTAEGPSPQTLFYVTFCAEERQNENLEM